MCYPRITIFGLIKSEGIILEEEDCIGTDYLLIPMAKRPVRDLRNYALYNVHS